MKTKIHPTYYENAQVVCSCGNRFTIGSTMETVHVDLCNKCHPFYTGEQKFIDTASRIQKFQKKQQAATTYKAKKVKKQEEKRTQSSGPKTLREMLETLK